MARVRGPLFSLDASGTLYKRVTYQSGKDVQSVRWNPDRPPQDTEPQLQHRQRVADCFTSWRALTPEEKAPWLATVPWRYCPALGTYMREWFAQNIWPPNQPEPPIW